MNAVMLLLSTFVSSLLLVSGSPPRQGNHFSQIQQANREENFTNGGVQRPASNRVGGFEEVYRWRQMTFTPLQQGNFLLLLISLCFMNILFVNNF